MIDTAARVPRWALALKRIQDEQPKTQKELADLMGISGQAVGKHLKKARAAGFLAKVGLALTEKGQKYVGKVATEDRF